MGMPESSHQGHAAEDAAQYRLRNLAINRAHHARSDLLMSLLGRLVAQTKSCQGAGHDE